jgi:hypothetical protein
VTALKRLDVPAPTKDQPNKRLKIGAKLRIAIDAIVFEGLDFPAAAARANCSVRSIRKAFERSHVLAYLRRRREVLRASACGSNISRLVQIRDAAENMPAIQAIRTLEQMGETDSVASSAQRSPGVVIIVQGAVSPPRVLENEDVDDAE